MAIPNDLNPFSQESLYEQYHLDPYAPFDEIRVKLEELIKSADASEAADLQQALNKVKNPRLRVLLNATLLDPVDPDKVAAYLEHLPGPQKDDVALPSLGLSQILIEGECEEFSESDFSEIAADSNHLLDPLVVKKEILYMLMML